MKPIDYLKSKLPRWFNDDALVINALLVGLAETANFILALIDYAKRQTRLKTAESGWLDMIAADLLGEAFQRKANESDALFRNRIIINLFRERATRNSLKELLTCLTGRVPIIFEPTQPRDTGVYGHACGYGIAGGYGSLHLPFQCFVTVFRPAGSGIPLAAGYGNSPGGYGTASRLTYASLAMITNSLTDKDLYDAVAATKPAGVTVWMRISN